MVLFAFLVTKVASLEHDFCKSYVLRLILAIRSLRMLLFRSRPHLHEDYQHPGYIV